MIRFGSRLARHLRLGAIPFFLGLFILGATTPASAQADDEGGFSEAEEGGFEEAEGGFEPEVAPTEDAEGGFEPEVAPAEDAEGGFEPEVAPAEDAEGGFEPEVAPAEDAEGGFEPEVAPAEDAESGFEPKVAPPTETPPQTASSPPPDAAPTDTAPTTEVEDPADTTPSDKVDDDSAEKAGDAETPAWLRVGDPIPLTRREPLVKQFQVEAALRYGLVGTGPTRLVNDIRFGVFDWLELRTSLLPWPVALMARGKIGSQQGPWGAFMLDGGLANFDAGVRIAPQEGETEVGPRFHFEGGIAYARALGDSFSVYGSARARYRLSTLKQDEQIAVAFDAHVTYDLLPTIGITAGVGYAEVIGTPVRELTVNFVEIDRPGMSHFLQRNDGWSRSVTIPMALTYGRVDTFDVDLFVTTRVWPQLDVIFGAGLRWRIQLFELDDN